MATWYVLAPNTNDPECGTLDKAIERLNFLWTTFGATTAIELFHNRTVSSLLTLKSKGVPFPGANPYAVSGALGLASLSLMGARQEYLSFPGLLQALCPDFMAIDWPRVVELDRRIMVGAIEILSGNFEIFDSDKTLENMGLHPNGARIEQYNRTHWRMRRPLSLEGIAASGTLPEVLPAQVIPNMEFPTCTPGVTVTREGLYWDGLYSQNPPVRDLLDAPDVGSKPDEIWVVRINPQEQYSYASELGLDEIRDRANALAGNLSLNQELDHIGTVNKWIQTYGRDHPPLKDRKVVTVRTIKMTRSTAWGLGPVDIRLIEGDSPGTRNRIQDWKTEASLGSKRIERWTMGADCAVAFWQARRSWALGCRQSAISRSGALDCPDGLAVARSAGRVRELEFSLQALSSMGVEGRVRAGFQ